MKSQSPTKASIQAPGRALPSGPLVGLILAAVLGLAFIACGSSADSDWPDVLSVQTGTYARVVSNELTVGQSRFVFGLLDKDDQPITDAAVRVRFFNLDESKSKAVTEAEARQVHTGGTVPEYEWLYDTSVTFQTAGDWGAEFDIERTGQDSEVVRYRFPVQREPLTFGIGDAVPRTRNLTLNDVGGNLSDRHLTTDPEPDPAMYQMSIAEALGTGKPLVAVFATPGFCVTRTCGPMVDVVKGVRPEFADRVNFIHVEITDLDATNAKREVVYNSFDDEWKLPSEPWTFVVDREGKVFAKFEGVLLPDELRDALNQLLAQEAA